MDKDKKDYIDKLEKKRADRRLRAAIELRALEKTSKDLYSNSRSHFIYEVIQNAADANATFISFDIVDNFLTVNHNGCGFSIRDVLSITRYRNSNKKQGKIGRLGIGFKSVFSVTDCPQIHSGGFHFCLKNMVVPQWIEPTDTDSDTRIIIPFKDTKFRDAAIGGLQKININELLFLNNIKKYHGGLVKNTGNAAESRAGRIPATM